MSPQPQYSDGGWPTHSRFVYEPDERLLPGHWTVISTASDLEKYLGGPLTVENIAAFRAENHGDHDNLHVNWPLIEAGLRRTTEKGRRGFVSCGTTAHDA